jgi:HK97 family phage prohead protease
MKTQWQAGDRIECDMMFEAEAKADAPDGYIAGIASTTSTDLYGHKVLAHAFDDSIKQKGLTGPRGIKLLASHDWHKPAGVIKSLETVGKRLKIEAQLNLNVSYVKDLYEVTKQNGGLNFSVGFALEEFEFVDDEDIKNADDPWLIIKKGDLMEVSVVVFPAQLEAEMTFVKEVNTMTDFEKALVANGICQSRQQAHKLAAWAKKNVHLLQPKIPLLGEKAQDTQPHPLLDASMLKPMADLIAKARAQLP